MQIIKTRLGVRGNFSQETPILPPSIDTQHLLKLAKKRETTQPTFNSKLMWKIQTSEMWAAIYVWLCFAIETSKERKIKFKAFDAAAALHIKTDKLQKNFLSYFILMGHLKRSPKNTWLYHYVSIGELLNRQAVEAAIKTLGIEEVQNDKA